MWGLVPQLAYYADLRWFDSSLYRYEKVGLLFTSNNASVAEPVYAQG